MPGLLDLPNEILSQIASYAVSTSEYPGTLPRRSCLPSHWYTCKRWYNVVSPIFYEGMLRSKKQRMLYLSYNDLVRLPGEQTQLHRYYSTKLEKISLRLQGQPSHDVSIRPFFDSSNESLGDNGAIADSSDGETASPDSSTIGLVGNFDRDYQNFLETQGRLLNFKKSNWKNDLARRLRIFSDLVSKCESLDELTFQAYYGYDSRPQSQWDYLDCGAMEYFVLRLPPNLKYLTLDLAGTMMVPSRDSESEHLCPAVAQCILNVENVRLRLRHACPSVFGIKSIQISTQQECTQESTQRSVNSVHDQVPGGSVNQRQLQFIMHENPRIVGTSRLKSLVLRLSLPFFPSDPYSDRPIPFDVRQCRRFPASRTFGLPRVLALAARHVLELEPGIESFKISFKMPSLDNPVLFAHDCVRWRLFTVGEGKHEYEDDGERWEDWENRTDVVVTEVPTPAEGSRMAIDHNAFPPAGSTVDSYAEWMNETEIPTPAEVAGMAIEDNVDRPSGSTEESDHRGTDESEEDEEDEEDKEDNLDYVWSGDSEDDEDRYVMSAFANYMHLGSVAADLGIGDIMDLMEHDMIFGSDHTPI